MIQLIITKEVKRKVISMKRHFFIRGLIEIYRFRLFLEYTRPVRGKAEQGS